MTHKKTKGGAVTTKFQAVCAKCAEVYTTDKKDVKIFYASLKVLKDTDPASFASAEKVYREDYCDKCAKEKAEIARKIDAKHIESTKKAPGLNDLPFIEVQGRKTGFLPASFFGL